MVPAVRGFSLIHRLAYKGRTYHLERLNTGTSYLPTTNTTSVIDKKIPVVTAHLHYVMLALTMLSISPYGNLFAAAKDRDVVHTSTTRYPNMDRNEVVAPSADPPVFSVL
jgi:hypothetical protein